MKPFKVAIIAALVAAAGHAAPVQTPDAARRDGQPVPAAAPAVRVTFAMPLEKTVPAANVEVHARSEAGDERTATMPLQSGGTIALPPGLWELNIAARGYWSRPETTNVTATGASVDMAVFRTTAVRGEVSGGDVHEITLAFSPTPTDPPSRLPSASVRCPVEASKFVCHVPIAVADLAVRAAGFVPVYRWSQNVKPQYALGTVALRRGSSFTGTVTFAEKQKKAPPVTVSVWPEPVGPRNETLLAADALRKESAVANARGFFQFALAPGAYRVQATAPGGLLSEEIPIRVIDGRESSLRAPLVITRPSTITVRVTPPVAPYDKAWNAIVFRRDKDGVVDFEMSGDVPRNGEWVRDGIPAGDYTLQIRRSDEDAWASMDVDLRQDHVVDVSVPVVKLTGKLTLGGEPLGGATVWLDGPKSQRVGIVSRRDGTFGPIAIPDVGDESWRRAQVHKDEPHVDRDFEPVTLTRNDRDERVLLLDLKGGTIFGDVKDAEGHIQINSMIDVSADGDYQQVIARSGQFVARAMRPGRITLRASSPNGETDQPTIVEMKEDDQTEVHLVVKPSLHFHATVRTFDGPATSASFSAFSFEQWPMTAGLFPVTPDGGMEAPMPPGTRSVNLAVAVPGYAFRLVRVPLQSDPPLTLLVEPQGGTLEITTPAPRDGVVPYLMHEGAMLPVWMVSQWANGSAAGNMTTVPLMEQGAYTLCLLHPAERAAVGEGFRPADRCVSGLLARGGTLALKAPDGEARSR